MSEADDEIDAEAVSSSRGNQYMRDVRETKEFGTVIIQPSIHFERIFALFDKRQRAKFVKYAFGQLGGIEKKDETIHEFVREILSHDEEPLDDEDFDYNCSDDDYTRALYARGNMNAALVISGDDHRGLAKVLVNTLFIEEATDTAKFDRFFADALGSSILLPEQAAAVATCVLQSRSEFQRFEKEADYLLTDAGIVRRKSFDDEASYMIARERTAELRDLFGVYQATGIAIAQHQAMVVRPEQLVDRFKLEVVAGGLYVPIRRSIVLARTIDEAIRLAESDKASLLAMEARRFEEFMAEFLHASGLRWSSLSVRAMEVPIYCVCVTYMVSPCALPWKLNGTRRAAP